MTPTAKKYMRRASALVWLLMLILWGAAVTPRAEAALPSPAWAIQSIAGPTNFEPGDESGSNTYEVFVTNIGGEATDGTPIVIRDTLPAGLTFKSAALNIRLEGPAVTLEDACLSQSAPDGDSVTCTIDESTLPDGIAAALLPNQQFRLRIAVGVPADVAGTLINHVMVEGGGAAVVSREGRNLASPENAPAGFQEMQAILTQADGSAARAAGSHPYQYVTTFSVNTESAPPGSPTSVRPAQGDLKNIEVALPPGLIGNPLAAERCTAQQFTTTKPANVGGSSGTNNDCPDGSAVGVVSVEQLEGVGQVGASALYNLVPPPGMPAQLGFQLLGLPFYINTKLRSDSDYGITAYLVNTSEAKRVTAAMVSVWGMPADRSHDPLRGGCVELGGSCSPGPSSRPFLRLPSSCESPLGTSMSFDTWLTPGVFQQATSQGTAPTDCDKPDFTPSISARPTTALADAPSGLDFNLHLPQSDHEDPEGTAEADLRRAEVVLPEGFVVNPASAAGREACAPSQVGLTTPVGVSPARFDAFPAACPDEAKIGTVEVETPLVDHPLPGAVYLAQPDQNPFGSLLAIYIAVHDPATGVVVKLAGHVQPDPATGRLTTTVEESPQTPFEDFRLEFFGGPRAPLRTPPTCGTFTTTASLRPWSHPASGADATASDSFALDGTAGGAHCPRNPDELPHAPSFEAGTTNPVAGSFSPFTLRLAREDGSQELEQLNLDLPPGLLARLAGVPYCPDGAIASAAARSGREEQAGSSCPVASEVGTVTVGAGAGPAPYYVQGMAYLAGPYKGAPLSMAIVTPAVAGPFDLGTVVVRVALRVDPETANVHAVSGPIPTILDGIPLDVRSVVVKLDRGGFILNPTSCEPTAVSGQAISKSGSVAALSQRFQVGGCGGLGFKPRLSLRLKGGTERGDYPALRATLVMPPGGANIRTAQVALPHSEFLEQAHIRTICTRVQFAANACPKRAIYGQAKAWTPLLDAPLSGPVYLRSSDNPLPDLVADLNGQVRVVLHGRTDSKHGGIRNTFEAVPDAPVSKFVLSLQGGKKGLLVNSRNTCERRERANAKFVAQNGMIKTLRPVLKRKCAGRKAGHNSGGSK